jgi:ribosomal protein S18 acetylase RimI-like enzyme
LIEIGPRAGLNDDDIAAIRQLADTVNQHDGLSLKLNWELMRERDPAQVNDFFALVGEELVGYAALDGFGDEFELTGMVHPAYRRQGLGRHLLQASIDECRGREVRQLLLVCERASETGQAFVAARGDALRAAFSEYRLELDAATASPLPPQGTMQLRPASATDLPTISAIRAAAFGDPPQEATEHVAHAFTEQGSRLFVAEVGGTPVGTIGVVTDENGMYLRALAVAPDQQGRGFGRAILAGAVALMLGEGHTHLALDVATENCNALSLYLSCGFRETNCYDYFDVRLDATTP